MINKEKIEKKLQNVYDSMACTDPRKTIHKTALAAAGIVVALPVGIDAWALRLSEVLMLISVYSHYGIKLTRSAAESLLTAGGMQIIGEAAAYTALEAANTASVLTFGTSKLICIGIASGLIETVGFTTIKYIEGNKLAKAAVRIIEGSGAVADAVRIAKKCVSAETIAAGETTTLINAKATGSAGMLAFTGNAANGIYAGRGAAEWMNEASKWSNKRNGVNNAPTALGCLQNAAKALFGDSTSSQAHQFIRNKMCQLGYDY